MAQEGIALDGVDVLVTETIAEVVTTPMGVQAVRESTEEIELVTQKEVHNGLAGALGLTAHVEHCWAEPIVQDNVSTGQKQAQHLFDLNVECTEVSQDAELMQVASTERVVLGTADDRLNKGRGHSGHRPSFKGVARFVAPLSRSLLCNPMPRTKIAHHKKVVTTESVATDSVQQRAHQVIKGAAKQPVEVQATTLLMQAAGVLVSSEEPSDEVKQQFIEKFVTQLEGGLVGDMRTVLGLLVDGGADSLSGLTVEVDDTYDS